MRTQFRAISIKLCAALLAILVVLPGCGGGPYSTPAAGPGGMGDTPPAVRSANHWTTSFEATDGYSLGNIDGQQGWELGWNPRPTACAATVSSDMAATGSQCLKLEYYSSTNSEWWNNTFQLLGPSGAVPYMQFTSVTFRFKIYRDPGETEYPQGSGNMHPNIWFNAFAYNPSVRYIDFGDPAQDSKLHASLQNSTPRTWDDPGWEQITGRFVDVVIYDNYQLGIRIVWYDGRKVATVPIYNADKAYGDFSFGYGAANPLAAAELGKPMYIDDIDINWEPATPQ